MRRDKRLVFISTVLCFVIHVNCEHETFINTCVEWCLSPCYSRNKQLCKKTLIVHSNRLVENLPLANNKDFKYCIKVSGQSVPVLYKNSLSNINIGSLEISSSGVSDIEDGAFANMSTSSLTITRNSIERLSKGDFKDASVSEKLDLSANGIKYIEDGTFEGMTLNTLDLSKNELEEISSGVFSKLSVGYLALNGNKLKTITNAILENIEFIQFLNLDDNLITTIEPGAFKKLDSPAFLYIQNNLLENISQGVFSSNVYTELILSGNNIKTISPGAFECRGVEYLNLSGNHLEEIRKGVFDSILQIRYLILPNNKIRNIEPHALDSVHGGVQLDNNELEVIKENVFKFAKIIVLLNNKKLRKIEVGAFDDHDRDESLFPTEDKDKPRILYLEHSNNLDEESKNYLNGLVSSGKFEWRTKIDTNILFSR